MYYIDSIVYIIMVNHLNDFNMKQFKDKKILITGASKGIGRACAIRFAKDGATIIINYNSSKEDAEETLKQVIAAGGKGNIVKADMGKVEEVQQLWKSSIEDGLMPASLILNAAFQKKALVDDTDIELIRQTLEVNIIGNFALAKLFIDKCREISWQGSIVVHSSNQSEFVNPTGFAYGISKAALNHMVKHMARSTAKDNIRINAVLLGWFNTEGERKFHSAEKIEKDAFNTIPLRRIGKPEEAADISYFLASDASSYMTGSLVRLDGGFALDPDLTT